MKRIKVCESEFGEAWPLTISEGFLLNNSGAIIFETGNEKYAVNGVAQLNRYADIDSIWSDNDEIPGTKKTLGPLIELGMS